LRAWDSLYCAFLDVPPHQFFDLKSEKQNLQNYLDVARRQLSGQRDRVLTLLKRYQLDDGIDSPFRGGLFVLAKLGEDHVDLAKQCALIINPPAWGRTPGWSRICFSLTPERFEAAMARMEGFLKSKYGSLRAVHSELTGT
jgi:DNA-binding transcriptional MocR family regulator